MAIKSELNWEHHQDYSLIRALADAISSRRCSIVLGSKLDQFSIDRLHAGGGQVANRGLDRVAELAAEQLSRGFESHNSQDQTSNSLSTVEVGNFFPNSMDMYEYSFGRSALVDLVESTLATSRFDPSATHHAIMQIPWNTVYNESVFPTVRRADSLERETIASVLDFSYLPKSNIIVQPFGSTIERRDLVLTNEDLRQLERHGFQFFAHYFNTMNTDSFLYVLRDSRSMFRIFMDKAREFFPSVSAKSFALVESSVDAEFLRRRGMNPIDVSVFEGEPVEFIYADLFRHLYSLSIDDQSSSYINLKKKVDTKRLGVFLSLVSRLYEIEALEPGSSEVVAPLAIKRVEIGTPNFVEFLGDPVILKYTLAMVTAVTAAVLAAPVALATILDRLADRRLKLTEEKIKQLELDERTRDIESRRSAEQVKQLKEILTDLSECRELVRSDPYLLKIAEEELGISLVDREN